MSPTRRTFIAAVFTVASVLLVGCGSDRATAPAQLGILSTWNLVTANGAPLPFTVPGITPRLDVTSDKLVLKTDGTFTESTQANSINGTTVTPQTIPDGGTYTLTGTSATFVFTDGTVGVATITATTLSVVLPTVALVYQKQ
jgi:hypothetical protein